MQGVMAVLTVKPLRQRSAMGLNCVSVPSLLRAPEVPIHGFCPCAGSSGQTASRIILQLLEAGYKVVAGAPDAEQATRAVAFAKKYEILTKEQVGAPYDTPSVFKGTPYGTSIVFKGTPYGVSSVVRGGAQSCSPLQATLSYTHHRHMLASCMAYGQDHMLQHAVAGGWQL